MKLLVVEDEPDLRSSMVEFLEKEGHLCEKAKDFRSGEDKLAVHEYDIVILDIMLPGGSGLELLKLLKEIHPESGVLIVSAKDSLEDKIKGLDLGADDYITKPFHMAELNSRIQAIFRRKYYQGNEVLNLNEIVLEPKLRSCKVNGNELDLTRKEFDLLMYFAVNQNRVLSKESIAEHLWGDEMDISDSFDFIYTHIKNLRKKLIAAGAKDYIQSVYGAGYKISLG